MLIIMMMAAVVDASNSSQQRPYLSLLLLLLTFLHFSISRHPSQTTYHLILAHCSHYSALVSYQDGKADVT